MTIYGENGGNPHRDVSDKAPEEPITGVHVLVTIHPNGGEGVYGQMIGNVMTNFVAPNEERRQMLDELLRQQGTFEVAPRLGVKLEWRLYTLPK